MRRVKKVRADRESQPRRRRAHFLWRPVVFCMLRGTCVLRNAGQYMFPS